MSHVSRNRSIYSSRPLIAAAAVFALSAAGLRAAEVDVPNGTTDLAALATTATDDLTFTNIVYAPATIGIGANLTVGTLNSLDATQTIVLNNPTAATTNTVTIAGGTGNAVAVAAGGASTDLIYVAAGGGLTVVGTGTGLGTLGAINFGTGGTLNINGQANLGPVLNWGANTLTKTGAGTLTLNAANTGTGGLVIANGTVTAAGTNNTTLGSAGSVVTLGSGANNAALNFSSTPSGVAPSFVVAAGTGTRTISASNSVGSGNGVVISTGVLLNNNLTVSQTGTNAGNIQFRGTITESGGSFGITVNNTNPTTIVQLRGANTFTGGVTVASGIALFNTNGSAGSVGALTSGPFGTGTITLGTGANAATIASDSFQGIGNAITVAAGGPRAVSQLSGGSSAMGINGPVTLNADLTLNAVATTLTTGVNRMRIGTGGLTGTGNVIVNNANTLSGNVAGSGAIRLDGPAAPNAGWTGGLIVQNGQASLNSNNALGAANVVGVSSTGWFNHSEAILSPTIAGLSNATAAGALGGGTGGVVQASTASSRTLTLAGAGNYVFDGVIKNNTNGTNTAALTVNLASPAASQTLNGANTYTGATTVQNGSLILATAAQSPVLSGPGGANVLGGRLVLDYTGGTSPVAGVKTILDAGAPTLFATGQIRSTLIPAGQTVGYCDNGTRVTIRLTLAGDADLDGDVDFNDFLSLQTNFGNAGTRFDQGNFNYDAATDFNDFLALQTNFGQSIVGDTVAFTSEQVAAMTAFGVANAVPEPAGLAALALGGVLLRRRRR